MSGKRLRALIFLFVIGFAGSAWAEDFALTDLDGGKHRLADYRGKWVLINYWASWCPPCLAEIPELISFHDAHQARDAVVLGLDAEHLRAFAEDWLISYPLFQGAAQAALPGGSLRGLPTSLLISPQGEVVAREEGSVTREDLEGFIAHAAETPAKTASAR